MIDPEKIRYGDCFRPANRKTVHMFIQWGEVETHNGRQWFGVSIATIEEAIFPRGTVDTLRGFDRNDDGSGTPFWVPA